MIGITDISPIPCADATHGVENAPEENIHPPFFKILGCKMFTSKIENGG